VNWLKKASAAFSRFKARAVKHQEVKQWGMNILNRLFEIVGVDGKGCPPREVDYTEVYGQLGQDKALLVEMRVPFCEEEDLKKMDRAVEILAKEARELTPVDTGRLVDSQYDLVFTEKEGNVVNVVGVVGYDISEVFREQNGNTVFYALAVHNREAYHGQDRFPNNPPRATWKFLELAANNGEIRRQIQELFR
jgi:hypothetical protein